MKKFFSKLKTASGVEAGPSRPAELVSNSNSFSPDVQGWREAKPEHDREETHGAIAHRNAFGNLGPDRNLRVRPRTEGVPLVPDLDLADTDGPVGKVGVFRRIKRKISRHNLKQRLSERDVPAVPPLPQTVQHEREFREQGIKLVPDGYENAVPTARELLEVRKDARLQAAIYPSMGEDGRVESSPVSNFFRASSSSHQASPPDPVRRSRTPLGQRIRSRLGLLDTTPLPADTTRSQKALRILGAERIQRRQERRGRRENRRRAQSTAEDVEPNLPLEVDCGGLSQEQQELAEAHSYGQRLLPMAVMMLPPNRRERAMEVLEQILEIKTELRRLKNRRVLEQKRGKEWQPPQYTESIDPEFLQPIQHNGLEYNKCDTEPISAPIIPRPRRHVQRRRVNGYSQTQTSRVIKKSTIKTLYLRLAPIFESHCESRIEPLHDSRRQHEREIRLAPLFAPRALRPFKHVQASRGRAISRPLRPARERQPSGRSTTLRSSRHSRQGQTPDHLEVSHPSRHLRRTRIGRESETQNLPKPFWQTQMSRALSASLPSPSSAQTQIPSPSTPSRPSRPIGQIESSGARGISPHSGRGLSLPSTTKRTPLPDLLNQSNLTPSQALRDAIASFEGTPPLSRQLRRRLREPTVSRVLELDEISDATVRQGRRSRSHSASSTTTVIRRKGKERLGQEENVLQRGRSVSHSAYSADSTKTVVRRRGEGSQEEQDEHVLQRRPSLTHSTSSTNAVVYRRGKESREEKDEPERRRRPSFTSEFARQQRPSLTNIAPPSKTVTDRHKEEMGEREDESVRGRRPSFTNITPPSKTVRNRKERELGERQDKSVRLRRPSFTDIASSSKTVIDRGVRELGERQDEVARLGRASFTNIAPPSNTVINRQKEAREERQNEAVHLGRPSFTNIAPPSNTVIDRRKEELGERQDEVESQQSSSLTNSASSAKTPFLRKHEEMRKEVQKSRQSLASSGPSTLRKNSPGNLPNITRSSDSSGSRPSKPAEYIVSKPHLTSLDMSSNLAVSNRSSGPAASDLSSSSQPSLTKRAPSAWKITTRPVGPIVPPISPLIINSEACRRFHAVFPYKKPEPDNFPEMDMAAYESSESEELNIGALRITRAPASMGDDGKVTEEKKDVGEISGDHDVKVKNEISDVIGYYSKLSDGSPDMTSVRYNVKKDSSLVVKEGKNEEVEKGVKDGNDEKDEMAKDEMAKDAMAKDKMAKDEMAKDQGVKDGKDEKDEMVKDVETDSICSEYMKSCSRAHSYFHDTKQLINGSRYENEVANKESFEIFKSEIVGCVDLIEDLFKDQLAQPMHDLMKSYEDLREKTGQLAAQVAKLQEDLEEKEMKCAKTAFMMDVMRNKQKTLDALHHPGLKGSAASEEN